MKTHTSLTAVQLFTRYASLDAYAQARIMGGTAPPPSALEDAIEPRGGCMIRIDILE